MYLALVLLYLNRSG